MKIFSPHRRKMEASRRYGSKEFQNKIKKAQGYKRVFDPRTKYVWSSFFRRLKLDTRLGQVSLALVALVFLYFIYISPYFLVSQVVLTGNHQMSLGQVSEVLTNKAGRNWLFMPKKHLWLLSGSQAYKLLSQEYPLVKEIKGYKRIWPNAVEMEIVERQPGFAFSVSGSWFLVDSEGLVIKNMAEPGDLPKVVDQVNESVEVGERLNNTKLVGFIMSIDRQWSAKINTQIKEIKVPGKAAGQVQVLSNEGWEVFFDTSRSVESQVSNLNLVLSRQIPAKDRLKLAYIDLRFDKWAYYCYKDAPCQAQEQGVQPEGQGEVKLDSQVE